MSCTSALRVVTLSAVSAAQFNAGNFKRRINEADYTRLCLLRAKSYAEKVKAQIAGQSRVAGLFISFIEMRHGRFNYFYALQKKRISIKLKDEDWDNTG